MWTFNCARIYLGSYLVDTNEFCRSIKCGYKVLQGNVSTRELKLIKVRQHQTDDFAILRAVIIYPATDEVIISVSNRNRERQIRLVKRQTGKSSTIYKMRL